MSGITLFDEVIHSSVDPQTFEVLQIAIKPPGRRQQKNLFKSKFTLSKSQGFDHGANVLGFEYDAYVYTLDLCVRILVPNARSLSDSIGITRNDILDICAPESLPEKPSLWSARQFYDNVHVPKIDGVAPDVPSIDQLQCKLYSFQKRAVQWLLWREGAVESHEPSELPGLPHGFVRTTDGDGRQCLISPFWGMATTDEQVPVNMSSEPKGGILAEEMGLGKTVEMIALFTLHKWDPTKQSPSPENFPRCSATLIITPPAILQQWRNELQRLAPSLSVFVYKGLRVEAGKSDHEALMSRCMQHDIVLTTYNVIASEIYYAEAPDRNLRHEKRYEKRLSPLTQIYFWRVVLDEAQMVESGVSNAAKVAKLIPRDISWYVHFRASLSLLIPQLGSQDTSYCTLFHCSGFCPLPSSYPLYRVIIWVLVHSIVLFLGILFLLTALLLGFSSFISCHYSNACPLYSVNTRVPVSKQFLTPKQVCERYSGKERCKGSFRTYRFLVLQAILRFARSCVGTSCLAA